MKRGVSLLCGLLLVGGISVKVPGKAYALSFPPTRSTPISRQDVRTLCPPGTSPAVLVWAPGNCLERVLSADLARLQQSLQRTQRNIERRLAPLFYQQRWLLP